MDATAEPSVINEGETSELTAYASGGSGDYFYEWEPAEYLDYPNTPNPVASPVLPSTEFVVTVTDSDGNTARAYVTVTIRNVSVGEDSLNVSVFPNPTEGNFTVKGILGDTQYRLTNSLGQTILSGTANRDFKIDQQLAKGLYFLRLSSNNQVSTMKITVK